MHIQMMMMLMIIKKAKGTKKCVIKQELMFQNFKDCLSNNKNVYRSQQRFKSYNHDVYTEEVNKIALSSNDDKRIQTFDGIATYPYGTKVCESEILEVKNYKNSVFKKHDFIFEI